MRYHSPDNLHLDVGNPPAHEQNRSMSPEENPARRAAADALPVAPSMEPALASVQAPAESAALEPRVVFISAVAVAVAAAAGLVAVGLIRLIGLITNLAYLGRLSTNFVAPDISRLGAWSILVPVAGALVIGVMARYGSAAIRGHGIPEVMERVLLAGSRISARVMFLKPLSSAIAIGTGGPFGAEGPIIATGGALGSVVGQALRITADERKTLLAAGAAAGMAATFGSPVSAVLLAVELLLFEYRARSLVPVALASATATVVRIAFFGNEPIFHVPTLAAPDWTGLTGYAGVGVLLGLAAVGVTRAVYGVEDAFERLPVHWMWWPAFGAVAVGVIGYIEPRTLGVGYAHIEAIIDGRLVGRALFLLVALKFVSWAIYLGSGTSGGTLAPLFIIGGGLGGLLGELGARLLPGLGLDPHAAALVGMAAMFAGASHALLASVVFAFETTRQPMALLPILAGSAVAYGVSMLLMSSSIMTEKLARRGMHVRTDYAADFFSQVLVAAVATRDVTTLSASVPVQTVRQWLTRDADAAAHQGFPVLDAREQLVGVVTRRDILESDGVATIRELVRRPPAIAYEDSTLREAADLMVRAGVGRLPVVRRDRPSHLTGIVTRSDLLSAHTLRLEAAGRAERAYGRRPDAGP